MKQPTIFLFIILFGISSGQGQGVPSHQQTADLVLLGRVWGFLKYFHPAVACGKVAWDDELLRLLPGIRRVSNDKERDDLLIALIDRLGEVPPCDSCQGAPPVDARLKPDFAWMDAPWLSPGPPRPASLYPAQPEQGSQQLCEGSDRRGYPPRTFSARAW